MSYIVAVQLGRIHHTCCNVRCLRWGATEAEFSNIPESILKMSNNAADDASILRWPQAPGARSRAMTRR